MGDNLKTQILCYGDSNTYGYKPNPDVKSLPEERYTETERWTGILQSLLGPNYSVHEEGLNGRTTNITGTLKGDKQKNGFESFVHIYPKYLPLNFLVLQLGTNDLKERFNRTAKNIAEGIDKIITYTFQKPEDHKIALPKVIILVPPIINEEYIKPPYKMTGAFEKSKEMVECFREVAIKHRCYLINLGEKIHFSPIDGLHLDMESHKVIAEMVKDCIINLEG